jgi:hypothetical protein
VRALRPFYVRSRSLLFVLGLAGYTLRDHIAIRLEIGRPREVHANLDANRDVGEIVGKVGFRFVLLDALPRRAWIQLLQ